MPSPVGLSLLKSLDAFTIDAQQWQRVIQLAPNYMTGAFVSLVQWPFWQIETDRTVHILQCPRFVAGLGYFPNGEEPVAFEDVFLSHGAVGGGLGNFIVGQYLRGLGSGAIGLILPVPLAASGYPPGMWELWNHRLTYCRGIPWPGLDPSPNFIPGEIVNETLTGLPAGDTGRFATINPLGVGYHTQNSDHTVTPDRPRRIVLNIESDDRVALGQRFSVRPGSGAALVTFRAVGPSASEVMI